MEIDCYIFSPFMKNRVCSNIESSLTVAMKWNGAVHENRKINEESGKLFEFTQSHSHSTILSFGRGAGNGMLFSVTGRLVMAQLTQLESQYAIIYKGASARRRILGSKCH